MEVFSAFGCKTFGKHNFVLALLLIGFVVGYGFAYFHHEQSYWVRFMDYVHVVLGGSSWHNPSSSFGNGSPGYAAYPLTAIIGAAISKRLLALQSG